MGNGSEGGRVERKLASQERSALDLKAMEVNWESSKAHIFCGHFCHLLTPSLPQLMEPMVLSCLQS